MELAARIDASARAGVGGRPVLLATLGVPFDPAASAFAVDAAVEAGSPLVVVNAVELPFLATSVILGYDQLAEDPAIGESIREPVRLAASLGVQVEHLRVKSPRPVAALLEVVAERDPGLVVFGPDRSHLRRRRYAKAAKAVRERASCLVWLPA